MPANVSNIIGVCSTALEKGSVQEPLKKIEQEASGDCHKFEYLTLLNTFENATTRDWQGPSEFYLG
jgi:hypothetical protein